MDGRSFESRQSAEDEIINRTDRQLEYLTQKMEQFSAGSGNLSKEPRFSSSSSVASRPSSVHSNSQVDLIKRMERLEQESRLLHEKLARQTHNNRQNSLTSDQTATSTSTTIPSYPNRWNEPALEEPTQPHSYPAPQYYEPQSPSLIGSRYSTAQNQYHRPVPSRTQTPMLHPPVTYDPYGRDLVMAEMATRAGARLFAEELVGRLSVMLSSYGIQPVPPHHMQSVSGDDAASVNAARFTRAMSPVSLSGLSEREEVGRRREEGQTGATDEKDMLIEQLRRDRNDAREALERAQAEAAYLRRELEQGQVTRLI